VREGRGGSSVFSVSLYSRRDFSQTAQVKIVPTPKPTLAVGFFISVSAEKQR
jgi:hypothetical protein